MSSEKLRVDYNRPPILEATLEYRFESALSSRNFEQFQSRIAREYPFVETLSSVNINFDGRELQASPQPMSLKMTNREASGVCFFSPYLIGVSALAPYSGWADLTARFQSVAEDLRKIGGFRKIVRAGTRTVNRIDIPVKDGPHIQIEDYLNAYIKLPIEMGVLGAFSIRGDIVDGDFVTVINSSAFPPPSLRFISIGLDIDVSTANLTAQNEPYFQEIVETLHERKNRMFEMSITDNARELFA